MISFNYPAALTTALADGVAAVLASEGVRHAHVLGGSYSGVVAQVLVRRHPRAARLTHPLAHNPARAAFARAGSCGAAASPRCPCRSYAARYMH